MSMRDSALFPPPRTFETGQSRKLNASFPAMSWIGLAPGFV